MVYKGLGESVAPLAPLKGELAGPTGLTEGFAVGTYAFMKSRANS